MHRFKALIAIATLCITATSFAQTNIFLSRDYWKSNPSIADIEQNKKKGNDLSEFNAYQFDPVVYAIIEKVPTETVKYLLTDAGNGVNKITHDGRTYLFWAAYAGDLDLMKYLIEQGAKTDLIDEHGNTVLIFAASNGQLDTRIYDLLIQHGADIKTETDPAGANALLLIAPYLQNLDLLPYFTSKGLDLKSTDDLGNGIFNYAARNGNTYVLEALIRKGVKYKELNKEKGNAILFACQGSRFVTNPLSVYEYLVSKGLDPAVTTTKGVTPLHILAARCKDPEIVQYFINQKADPNAPDNEGNLPLHIAASKGSTSIVKQLLRHTDNINQKNNDGQTPLATAIEHHSFEISRMLVDNQADVTLKDAKDQTLSYYLFKSFSPKDTETFDQKLSLLLEHGLDLFQKQGDGSTLYHFAAQQNAIWLIEKVHEIGRIDINTQNIDGLTALHIAAMKADSPAILQSLLKHQADRQIKTNFGETAYDLAAENELLQEQQIDISFLK